jgi:hypothetical protein
MNRQAYQAFGVAVVAVVLLSGCATFHRDWQRAPVPADSIEGRWDGFWRSDVDGHSGRLRCIMTKLDDRRYQARFQARYWKILRFSYTVMLDVEHTNGKYNFAGAADLAWWAGGQYKYEGAATATNFLARYESKHDHGIFQMSR